MSAPPFTRPERLRILAVTGSSAVMRFLLTRVSLTPSVCAIPPRCTTSAGTTSRCVFARLLARPVEGDRVVPENPRGQCFPKRLDDEIHVGRHERLPRALRRQIAAEHEA